MRADKLTTSKHTAGPWTYHSGAVYVDGPNVFPKGNENGVRIALMDREPTTPTTPCERDANARLIAAAPELLAACLKLAEWDHSLGDATLISEACSFARAAIAKAEGRADQ